MENDGGEKLDDTREIQDAFNAVAATYDDTTRTLVPSFDDFYELGLRFVRRSTESELRVLDLGAGTGLMSAFVMKRFPHARLTLIDLADDMMAVARVRFSHLGERAQFIIDDYSERLPSESFDLVVSALSIHHLEDHAKQRLFRKVRHAISGVGDFINADVVAAPSNALELDTHRIWKDELRDRGVTDSFLEASAQPAHYDRPATTGDQVRWLDAAGFAEIEVVFKHLPFTVFVART